MPAARSVAQLADQVREAAADHQPLRIVGGGSWLHAGRPCTGEPLTVGELRGVVEYVPGDLTLTALAGTTLAEIASVAAEHGQWLGLDPSASAPATIGATVATASDGPLAGSMGRVRDVVLGLQCITGEGEVIRSGGRVVKNVAGFDLVRLLTGAWGTLGAITEVSVRLRARPPVDRSFVFTADERLSLEARLSPLVDMTIEPLALELLNPAMAAALGLPASTCVLVRLGGNAQRVEAQREAMQALGEATEVPSSLFETLASLEEAHTKEAGVGVAARLSHAPTLLPALWRHLLEQCAAHQLWQPLVRASVSRGVVRVVLSADDCAMLAASERGGAFVAQLAPPGAYVSWEQLPAHLWSAVPSVVADPLSVALRRALDPHRVLNRGLLGEPEMVA